MIDHCRAGLAVYKAPVAVWQIDAFPTTPSPNGTKAVIDHCRAGLAAYKTPVQRHKLQELAQRRLDANARAGR